MVFLNCLAHIRHGILSIPDKSRTIEERTELVRSWSTIGVEFEVGHATVRVDIQSCENLMKIFTPNEIPT